jgi:large subunit ribosomal protein L20
MARVKRGPKGRQRKKRILKLAKGFRGSRKNRFRIAIHVVKRALRYAYRDRRVKKREFRQLWITRINAAARVCGLKYSQFMNGLKRANIEIDRSCLAELAVQDEKAFSELAVKAKTALAK